MNDRGIIAREVRRNIARNPGAAIAMVVASAVGTGLVGLVAEWFALVGRARALTEGSFAALGIDTQMDFRLPLLAGAVLGAEVIILSTTMVAVRRRRLSEGKFFELTLGAAVTYTKWPALAEGLGQGLAGGVVAVVLVVVAAPIITGGERTTAQVITAYTTFQVRGGPSSATTRVARLASLHLSLGDLSVIALVVAGLGALLGLLNAFISLRPPRHHGHDDPGD